MFKAIISISPRKFPLRYHGGRKLIFPEFIIRTWKRISKRVYKKECIIKRDVLRDYSEWQIHRSPAPGSSKSPLRGWELQHKNGRRKLITSAHLWLPTSSPVSLWARQSFNVLETSSLRTSAIPFGRSTPGLGVLGLPPENVKSI